jgi:hypothetical protein
MYGLAIYLPYLEMPLLEGTEKRRGIHNLEILRLTTIGRLALVPIEPW